MGKKKSFIWIALVLMFSLALTGCSRNEQAIFDASMKMQDVRTMQTNVKMTANLSGSGLEESMQQELDAFAEMLNQAKLNLDMKIDTNEDATVLKSEVDMNLKGFGQDLRIPYWIDMDYSEDRANPRFVEVFKFPEEMKSTLPPELMDKDYMIMDLLAMGDDGIQPIDMTGLMDLSRNLQQEQLEFYKSYAERYNPELDVVKKSTKDGEQYTIKLDDKEFKEFISYTVNHFAKDEEGLEFLNSYLGLINEAGAVENEVNQEQVDDFLAQFNLVMKGLNDVTILGDKGVEVSYTISDEGYIVKDHTLIDLRIDLKEFEALASVLGLQGQSIEQSKSIEPVETVALEPEVTEYQSPELKGIINLTIDIASETTNINEPLDINMPAVNANNAFDYRELMETIEAQAQSQFRLAGADRYETARVIAEDFNPGISDNIILASGAKYQDAMSATLLSKKLDAPVLLVGPTKAQSEDALAYISEHANQDTKVYLMGGKNAVSESVESELTAKGLSYERLSGENFYETNLAALAKADIAPGTPVVLASGQSFPDSLSAASFAAAKEYPLLLVGKDTLNEKTKNYVSTHNPSTVYIVGGEGIVSKSVEEQVKSLVPSASMKRLAGDDRFATSSKVLKELGPSVEFVYLANGFNYADAVAGSSLAARNGGAIVLVDPNRDTLPTASEAYLNGIQENGQFFLVWTLGGEKAVPQHLVEKVNEVLY